MNDKSGVSLRATVERANPAVALRYGFHERKPNAPACNRKSSFLATQVVEDPFLLLAKD
jgi:hypothetical protein